MGSATSSSSPTAGASPSVTPEAGSGSGGLVGGGDGDQQLGRILVGGLVAIGLLAVVGFAAIWRDRRRRQEASLALAPAEAAPVPTAGPRPRPGWDPDYGIEDEPIGTIEYQPPSDEA
ncbi:MAG: hypothetical protein M3O78_07125 [Chloroflexota bacterium]|nr:hypothetical protein [Chloroflexota bacterium]